VRFVPNGVPAAEPSGRDVRAELDIPPDGLVVGTVCVLRPEKALDGLVEAAVTLREEFPALVVLIVGEGPERERLEEVCRSRGLNGTVRFLGYRDDVPDVLAGLDVAVSCSNREGSSLAIMEYMEAACPVVATSVGGTPDLIESGVHGLLVEPRDPAALAGGLRELLRDAGLRQRMGRAARERRRREFDIDVTVRTIEDLYTELRAARAAAR
jgi:glycosyltransferase involved in cell wall biosynthesis